MKDRLFSNKYAVYITGKLKLILLTDLEDIMREHIQLDTDRVGTQNTRVPPETIDVLSIVSGTTALLYSR